MQQKHCQPHADDKRDCCCKKAACSLSLMSYKLSPTCVVKSNVLLIARHRVNNIVTLVVMHTAPFEAWQWCLRKVARKQAQQCGHACTGSRTDLWSLATASTKVWWRTSWLWALATRIMSTVQLFQPGPSNCRSPPHAFIKF